MCGSPPTSEADYLFYAIQMKMSNAWKRAELFDVPHAFHQIITDELHFLWTFCLKTLVMFILFPSQAFPQLINQTLKASAIFGVEHLIFFLEVDLLSCRTWWCHSDTDLPPVYSVGQTWSKVVFYGTFVLDTWTNRRHTWSRREVWSHFVRQTRGSWRVHQATRADFHEAFFAQTEHQVPGSVSACKAHLTCTLTVRVFVGGGDCRGSFFPFVSRLVFKTISNVLRAPG